MFLGFYKLSLRDAEKNAIINGTIRRNGILLRFGSEELRNIWLAKHQEPSRCMKVSPNSLPEGWSEGDAIDYVVRSSGVFLVDKNGTLLPAGEMAHSLIDVEKTYVLPRDTLRHCGAYQTGKSPLNYKQCYRYVSLRYEHGRYGDWETLQQIESRGARTWLHKILVQKLVEPIYEHDGELVPAQIRAKQEEISKALNLPLVNTPDAYAIEPLYKYDNGLREDSPASMYWIVYMPEEPEVYGFESKIWKKNGERYFRYFVEDAKREAQSWVKETAIGEFLYWRTKHVEEVLTKFLASFMHYEDGKRAPAYCIEAGEGSLPIAKARELHKLGPSLLQKYEEENLAKIAERERVENVVPIPPLSKYGLIQQF